MRSDAPGREQTTAPILLHAANQRLTAISTKPPCTHDANIDALKHTRRAAMQNSWIWALLLAMALCASLAFFLIEVWQIVEFIYR